MADEETTDGECPPLTERLRAIFSKGKRKLSPFREKWLESNKGSTRITLHCIFLCQIEYSAEKHSKRRVVVHCKIVNYSAALWTLQKSCPYAVISFYREEKEKSRTKLPLGILMNLCQSWQRYRGKKSPGIRSHGILPYPLRMCKESSTTNYVRCLKSWKRNSTSVRVSSIAHFQTAAPLLWMAAAGSSPAIAYNKSRLIR